MSASSGSSWSRTRTRAAASAGSSCVAAGAGAGLLLARADGEAQAARVGDQTGGRVFLFLETTDFEADHRRMSDAGVRFLEAPRREPYGTVAVFEDLYGARWDLIEPARP